MQQYNEVRDRLSRYSQVECEGGEEIGECPSDDEYAIFPMTPITGGEKTQELDASQDCGGGCGRVNPTDYDLE